MMVTVTAVMGLMRRFTAQVPSDVIAKRLTLEGCIELLTAHGWRMKEGEEATVYLCSSSGYAESKGCAVWVDGCAVPLGGTRAGGRDA